MKRSSLFGLFLWIAFILIGCGGTYRASHLREQPLEESEHIVYKNVTLKMSVAILDNQVARENGLLRVRAKIKNMLSKTVNAEVRVKFLDGFGYEIPDNAGWQPFPLERGDIKVLDRFATTPDAADYRILVRLAGDAD